MENEFRLGVIRKNTDKPFLQKYYKLNDLKVGGKSVVTLVGLVAQHRPKTIKITERGTYEMLVLNKKGTSWKGIVGTIGSADSLKSTQYTPDKDRIWMEMSLCAGPKETIEQIERDCDYDLDKISEIYEVDYPGVIKTEAGKFITIGDKGILSEDFLVWKDNIYSGVTDVHIGNYVFMIANVKGRGDTFVYVDEEKGTIIGMPGLLSVERGEYITDRDTFQLEIPVTKGGSKLELNGSDLGDLESYGIIASEDWDRDGTVDSLIVYSPFKNIGARVSIDCSKTDCPLVKAYTGKYSTRDIKFMPVGGDFRNVGEDLKTYGIDVLDAIRDGLFKEKIRDNEYMKDTDTYEKLQEKIKKDLSEVFYTIETDNSVIREFLENLWDTKLSGKTKEEFATIIGSMGMAEYAKEGGLKTFMEEYDMVKDEEELKENFIYVAEQPKTIAYFIKKFIESYIKVEPIRLENKPIQF